MSGATGNNVCRRCKKKRPEDEPMETARYRTCKPCREIERKRKRMKKARLNGVEPVDSDPEKSTRNANTAAAAAAAAALASNTINNNNNSVNNDNNSEFDPNLLKNIATHVSNSVNLNSLPQLTPAQVNANPDAAAAVAALQNAHHHQHHHHHQGPPQIQQYDQSARQDHEPAMVAAAAVISQADQKEIPIDENLLKEGTGEQEDQEEDNPNPSLNGPNPSGESNGDNEASLTKSPQSNNKASEGDIEKKSDASNIFAIINHEATKKGEEVDNDKKINMNDEINVNHGDKSVASGHSGPEKNSDSDNASLTKHHSTTRTTTTTTDNNKSNGDPSSDVGSNYCLYCGILRSIDDNGRYQLCGNCVNNPLQKANVFDDFEAYLERIELGRITDLKNIIFIKKFENDSEIPDFDQKNLDQVLVALTDRFIRRIIMKSGFRFSKSSSNLSAKPYPKSIKLLYKCKQDIKTIQKQQISQPNSSTAAVNALTQQLNGNRKLKTENCNSNFYLSYDVLGKNLSIKYNHNTHKTFLEKLYSNELIDKVRNLSKDSNDPSEIYTRLRETSSLTDDALKNEISQLKKVNFVKDFTALVEDVRFEMVGR